MPKTLSPSSLADRIQQLVNQRQQHAKAMATIDKTLEQIRKLLGAPTVAVKAAAAPAATVTIPSAKPRRKGHGRGSNRLTGANSILAFVKLKGTATTQEIKQHWASEGRNRSSGSPVLATLVTSGKLKRTKLKDGLGSRYALP